MVKFYFNKIYIFIILDLAKQRSQTKAEELKKSFSHQYIQKDKSGCSIFIKKNNY